MLLTFGQVTEMFLQGLLPFLFGGTAGGFVSYFLKQKIWGSVQRDLNTHSEFLKYQLNKEAINSEMNIKKKHEVYAEMLKLLRIADGAVQGLQGLGLGNTYQDYSVEDMERLLDERRVTKKMKQNIIEIFKRNSSEGIEEWKKYKPLCDAQDAQKQVYGANNFWLSNELYMSQRIYSEVADLVTDLKRCAVHSVLVASDSQRDPYDIKPIRDQLSGLTMRIDKLKEIMIQELEKTNNAY